MLRTAGLERMNSWHFSLPNVAWPVPPKEDFGKRNADEILAPGS